MGIKKALQEFRETSDKIMKLLEWKGGINFMVEYNHEEEGDVVIYYDCPPYKNSISKSDLDKIKDLIPEANEVDFFVGDDGNFIISIYFKKEE